MAITETGTPPATLKQTGTGTSTTASFTVPANSLVVVMAAGGWSSSSSCSASISDSSGKTWTTVAQSGGNGGCSAVGTAYFASSTSVTVSVAWSNLNGGRFVCVRMLSGALADQTGAASAKKNVGSNAFTQSITTTAANSVVYGAVDDGYTSDAFTAATDTTLIDSYANGTDGASSGAIKSTSAIATPATKTLGATTTNGSAFGSLALLEILADNSGTKANPDAPAAAVAAQAPSTARGIPAGHPAPVATAQAPSAGVGIPAAAASATATAQQPNVLSGTFVTLDLITATAAVEAPGLTLHTNAGAGLASATAAAKVEVAGVGAVARLAALAATAYGVTSDESTAPSAPLASAIGVALDAVTVSGTFVNPGFSLAVTTYDPSHIAVGVPAGCATCAVSAQTPAAGLGIAAGIATANVAVSVESSFLGTPGYRTYIVPNERRSLIVGQRLSVYTVPADVPTSAVI